MDPTEQWEDASNIMNTKANCDAILCRAESSGPRGQQKVLLAATEKEACFFNKSLIRFISSDSTVAVCLLGRKVLDLHPLHLSEGTLRDKIFVFYVLQSLLQQSVSSVHISVIRYWASSVFSLLSKNQSNFHGYYTTRMTLKNATLFF